MKISIQGWYIDLNFVYAISKIMDFDDKKFFTIHFKNRDEIDLDYSADLFDNNIEQCEKDREYIISEWKKI